jgi:hypothetical protein
MFGRSNTLIQDIFAALLGCSVSGREAPRFGPMIGRQPTVCGVGFVGTTTPVWRSSDRSSDRNCRLVCTFDSAYQAQLASFQGVV